MKTYILKIRKSGDQMGEIFEKKLKDFRHNEDETEIRINFQLMQCSFCFSQSNDRTDDTYKCKWGNIFGEFLHLLRFVIIYKFF